MCRVFDVCCGQPMQLSTAGTLPTRLFTRLPVMGELVLVIVPFRRWTPPPMTAPFVLTAMSVACSQLAHRAGGGEMECRQHTRAADVCASVYPREGPGWSFIAVGSRCRGLGP